MPRATRRFDAFTATWISSQCASTTRSSAWFFSRNFARRAFVSASFVAFTTGGGAPTPMRFPPP